MEGRAWVPVLGCAQIGLWKLGNKLAHFHVWRKNAVVSARPFDREEGYMIYWQMVGDIN